METTINARRQYLTATDAEEAWEQRHAGRQNLTATDEVEDWEQRHAGRHDLPSNEGVMSHIIVLGHVYDSLCT
jgi:hypothetical protein